MGEYCKQFTEEAGQKANAARDEAKGYAANAKASEKKATDAVAGIEQTKTDAVQAVQNAQTTATNAVQQAQSTATTAVTTKQTKAVQAVGTAQTGAVKAVDDERDAALQQVAYSTKAAQTAASNAAASEQAAQASKEAAATSAGAAESSATDASGSASAAATSERNAATSAQSAGTDADRAEAAAALAGTRANTDKTLKTEKAPADAKAVGDIVLDRTKDTPQPVFYSKAEVDKLLEDCKEAAKRAALLAANPVGKLWASDDPTSPASIMGGTWEQIKDRFILAAGDTYAAGSTGGEATHTLTVDEMPNHFHYVIIGNRTGNRTARYIPYEDADNVICWEGMDKSTATNYVGGSQPHNNMPPYVTMYAWKRIA
uniref:Baseplate protein n=1 Tax=Caudovirales sp. ctXjW8 TaxID=2826779 RepID=A0A8S5N4R2_9CAUD|nr:MAG TPA: baseplate protein [Caudovirales sp. ctXjW8]